MFAVYNYLRSLTMGRFVGDRGATAVEYGLMVAAIAAIIIVAVITLGGNVNDAFEFVNDQWITPTAP